RETVNRYYKKAAAIHGNILRVFSDPAYAAVNGGSFMDGSDRHIHVDLSPDIDGNLPSPLGRVHSYPPYEKYYPELQEDVSPRVRQHLHLLKLAVQRLGAWSKNYAEYEQLNDDLFRTCGAHLQAVEGVD
ncbi:uncharacterized protein B0T15DRAFT_384179, partial [Chaetomium strumarium]